MTIVNGDMWFEGNCSVLVLACCSCGKHLDRIESSEIPSYLDYVLRTADKAFCSDCDSSQDDIIHPFVLEMVSREGILKGQNYTAFWDLRLSCLP